MNARATEQQQAIDRYAAHLRHDPTNPLLLTMLGDLCHQLGRLDEALAHYEKCLAENPNHLAAAGRMANVLISQHRFHEAERSLLRVLDAGQSDPALLHNLGLSLYYQQHWQEALHAFERARNLGLNDVKNALYRAYALHHLGDLARAIEACEEGMRLAPDSAVNGYLALLQMDSGDMTQAHRRAQEVLAQQPDNVDASLVEGMWFAEQQEPERARECFDLAIQAEPTNPRGWLGLGLERLYRQDHEAAVGAFETALKYMPTHVGTIVTLGWTKFTQRDIGGAEHVFRHAISVDRSFGEAHGGLAVVLLFQRRISEGRRETVIARRLDPQGFGAVWARGALLALDGKREQGEAEVAAALQRPLTADGRTLFDHLQVFLRKEAARAGAPPLPTDRVLPNAHQPNTQ